MAMRASLPAKRDRPDPWSADQAASRVGPKVPWMDIVPPAARADRAEPAGSARRRADEHSGAGRRTFREFPMPTMDARIPIRDIHLEAVRHVDHKEAGNVRNADIVPCNELAAG